MVTRNARKYYRDNYTTSEKTTPADGKGATQTLNVKEQSQQKGRATTSPTLVAPSTPVVNKGKSTVRGKF